MCQTLQEFQTLFSCLCCAFPQSKNHDDNPVRSSLLCGNIRPCRLLRLCRNFASSRPNTSRRAQRSTTSCLGAARYAKVVMHSCCFGSLCFLAILQARQILLQSWHNPQAVANAVIIQNCDCAVIPSQKLLRTKAVAAANKALTKAVKRALVKALFLLLVGMVKHSSFPECLVAQSF